MSLMDQFNFSADVLVERLTKMADGKTEVAMLDEFNRLTLDVVCKVQKWGPYLRPNNVE